MRIQFITLFLIIIFTSCNKPGDKNFKGEWELTEFTMIQSGNTSTSDEKRLRDAGAVWNLIFTGDGEFQQDFNMSDREMTMKTQKGTWRTVADSLIILLDIDVAKKDMNYTYIIEEDVLTLDLQNPETKDKVVSKFRKK